MPEEAEPDPEIKKPRKKPKKPVSLTDRQKLEMFERFDTGRYSLMDMARWYGCSDTYISNLLKSREEIGREAVDNELKDGLALSNIEDSMAIGAYKIGQILSSMKPKEEKAKTFKDLMKTLMDIRKQLTVMPKDLDKGSAPINFEDAMRLTELIPEEHRFEYFQLMKGLAAKNKQETKKGDTD